MAKTAKLKRTGVAKSLKQKQSKIAEVSGPLKPKRTILVVVLTAFVTTFTGSALNLSIPDLGQQFGVSAGIVGWLVTGYTLAVAAFSVPAGRIADLTCRKTVLAAGIALFTACCIGPVLGGVLNQHFGWEAIFILTGIISAAALIAVFGLPGNKQQPSKPRSLDLTGNILYLISIVLLMYGLSEIGKGWIPPVLAAAGLAFGIFFLRHELKADDPAVDVRLFRQNIGYGFSNLSALLNYGATFAISYLVSIYLQVVQGFSSQATGLIMIAQPAIMAGLSPVAGRLSDKFSPFKLSSAGMGLCATGTCMFIFLGQNTSLWLVIAALAVTGLGFALFSSPNTNAVMSCVQEADYGVASSILATMRSIGHTLSMVVVTIIVTFYMQDASLAEAPPDILIRVMRISFIIFTGICIAGVFVSLKRR